MKTITLILVLICSFQGFGQYRTTLEYRNDSIWPMPDYNYPPFWKNTDTTLFISSDSVFIGDWILKADSLYWYKPDTIPVIIQYCDTTSYLIEVDVAKRPKIDKNNAMILIYIEPIYETIRTTDNSTRWMHGYIVTTNMWGEEIYIDEHKKPLPVNYVVWDYKLIKP